MAEFVYIHHPEVKSLGGPVTRQALDSVYSDKGWTEATAEQVKAHETGKAEVQQKAANLTAADVDSIRKRDELNELALARGVDPTQHDNMASLADAVKATL